MSRTAPFLSLNDALARHSALREVLGLSVHEFKRAVRLCRDDVSYADDFLLAVAWVDAAGLAVNVRGDRAAWNKARALNAVARMDCPSGLLGLCGDPSISGSIQPS